jgi:hypothetical protein
MPCVYNDSQQAAIPQQTIRKRTRHSKAVSSMCVASRLCMKFGGKADACFCELTVNRLVT